MGHNNAFIIFGQSIFVVESENPEIKLLDSVLSQQTFGDLVYRQPARMLDLRRPVTLAGVFSPLDHAHHSFSSVPQKTDLFGPH